MLPLLDTASPDGRGWLWRSRIKVHPVADEFPMMPEDELLKLGGDIKSNGLRQPIVFYTDTARPASTDRAAVSAYSGVSEAKRNLELQLVDGRNRLAAMEAANILDERFDAVISNAKILWGDDISPEDYVISANVHRRHLDAEQKRKVIAALLKARPERSDNATAKLAHASDKTVTAVRRELEATSEFPKLEKTVGGDGKARPAHKAPSPVQVRAMVESRQRSARVMSDQPAETPSQLRDNGISAGGRWSLVAELERLLHVLQGDIGRISEVPLHKRIALARGAVMALGLTIEDLRPIEEEDGETESVAAANSTRKDDAALRAIASNTTEALLAVAADLPPPSQGEDQ